MIEKLKDRIVRDPEILVGKPTIRGTRISVEQVLGLLAGGWPEAEILEQFPHLVQDDIRACLDYARDVIVKVGKTKQRASRNGGE